MKKVIKHGYEYKKAIFKHICSRCICEFEFGMNDIENTISDSRDITSFWRIKCPECGEIDMVERPEPCRFERGLYK